jgi:hypothetical protein
MGGDRETRIRRLRDAILDHVRLHPDASDTPAGIVNWWLPARGCEGAEELIDEVLNALAKSGVLRRVRLPDGGVLYGRHDAR